jgi:hypothetical protein
MTFITVGGQNHNTQHKNVNIPFVIVGFNIKPLILLKPYYVPKIVTFGGFDINHLMFLKS